MIEGRRRGRRAGRERSSRASRAARRRPASSAGEVPLAIDELPLVALLGVLRRREDGRQRGRGAAPQGVGPDRDGGRGPARASAPTIEATEDGFVVDGHRRAARRRTLDAAGDHRLAMLGAVAGLASTDGVEVDGMEAAAVSYPGFEADLARARRRLRLRPRWDGWPSPGHGERTRSRRESSVGQDLVALVRIEDSEQPGRRRRRDRRRASDDLDRAADDHEPGALVHLVLREALAAPAARCTIARPSSLGRRGPAAAAARRRAR